MAIHIKTAPTVDLTIDGNVLSGYQVLSTDTPFIRKNLGHLFRVKLVNPNYVAGSSIANTNRACVRDTDVTLVMSGIYGGCVHIDSLIQTIRRRLPRVWQRADFLDIPKYLLDPACLFSVVIKRDPHRLVILDKMVHTIAQYPLTNTITP